MSIEELIKIIVGFIIGFVIIFYVGQALLASASAQSLDIGGIKIQTVWILLVVFILGLYAYVKKFFSEMGMKAPSISNVSKSIEGNKSALQIARDNLSSLGIHEIAGNPPSKYELNDKSGWRFVFKTDGGDWIVDIGKDGHVINSAEKENLE